MNIKNYTNFSTAVVVTFLLAGCGGKTDQPELGLVTGAIHFEGAPLAGATVMFQPVDGRPAFGRTNTEGKYELTYIRNTPGCKIGSNSVAITSVDLEADNDSPERDADAEIQVKREIKKEVIPAKYNTKTELVVEVVPGKNTIDFDLVK